MKLKVIQKQKSFKITSEHILWMSIILLYVAVSLYYFEFLMNHSTVTVIILILGIVPILTNIFGSFEYYPRDYRVVDEINLEKEFIEIGEKRIGLGDIQSLRFEVNDWHGKKESSYFNIYGSGPRILRGVNNKLEIFHQNGIEKINFQIASNEQYEDLSDWLTNVYDRHVRVSEEFEHEKSYALHHLNLREAQQFKREHIH